MSVHGRIPSLKKAVSSGGELLEKYPELPRIGGYLINFALGFAMSCARIFGIAAPFGIGIVAQAGAGFSGLACLIGTCLGYFATGGFDWGIRYVAAAVLIYTASFMFQDIKLSRTSWFMPAIAGTVTAVTGFLVSFDMLSPIPNAVISLTETILAGGSTYFFKTALTPCDHNSEASELKYGVSLLLLLSCGLMSVARLEILGIISAGRLISVLIVMTASYKGSLTSGAAAGAALGLAMDISAGGAPFFTMAYAFSGLLSGIFSKHGKLFFLLSYILANTIAIIWTWGDNMQVSALYEAFAASVIFLILPSSLLNYFTIFKHTRLGEGEAGLRRYCADRVMRMGDAFQDLFETVHYTMESTANDNDIATVFDRAADAVCANCKNASGCWQENYVDTLNVMNDATEAMMKRGSLDKSDLPGYFVNSCLKLDSFVGAVNGELKGLFYRRQYKNRLMENRAAAYGQYADLAVIMEGVSEELNSAVGPDPISERKLVRYLQSLDIDVEATAFRDRSGRLRIVLEGSRLNQLTKDPEYLEKLSGLLGLRLCRPGSDDPRAEGRIILMEAEPLAVSVGIAAIQKKGESVSGDRGTYFKTDQGILCVILSDGMGSGEEAAKESIAAVRILERFLRSGVEPGTAMKILNSVMLLKNGEDWGYATVDLVCIDLFSGEACFYKYGAAPSYVKTGKTIRRVRCESFAAGMCAGEGGKPDVVRMRLKPGSVAIIASDGVLVENDEGWLRKTMSGFEGSDTKAMAKETLQGAIKQYGYEDDMTVLAVCVDKRQ